jgi:hypothetical protein
VRMSVQSNAFTVLDSRFFRSINSERERMTVSEC